MEMAERDRRERSILERLTRCEERLRADEVARKLLRADTSRRFHALNNAAATLEKQASSSVSRDLFDSTVRDVGEMRSSIAARFATVVPRDVYDAQVRQFEAWRETVNIRMATWAGGAAVIGSLAGLIAAYFMRALK